ncbi:MAG TPA: Hachiman antiphage defense system protein HamA [Parafilimonas sp.]|nr:Hachiman antiphage defense system protein HamA [Parafilimonas sp.]
MSLNILNHFDKSNLNGITVFKLKEDERKNFLEKLPGPFRSLYLSDEILNERIKLFGSSRINEILEKIPDQANIQSGEFAELLLYFFIPECYISGDCLNPPKWKWKQHKNRALQFTDVLILQIKTKDNPSVEDFLIAVESKAQATKPGKDVIRLHDAIRGSEEDYVSRLAESLVYLKARYKDELNVDSVKYLERFMETPRFPSYIKYFKAVGIVDDEFAGNELSKADPTSKIIKDSLEVILISMKDMKEIYENVYSQMPNK